MSRRFSVIGGARRQVRSRAAANSSAAAPTLDALGSSLLYQWEADADYVTLSGSDIISLAGVVGGVTLTDLSTPTQRPLWNASGGPNDLPHISFPAVSDFLYANALTIGAANRVGLLVVMSTGAGVHCPFRAYSTGGVQCWSQNATQWWHQITFTGGNQMLAITGADSGWHAHEVLPLASGAISAVDGVTTSPNFTGSDTNGAMTAAAIGHNGGISGGKFWGAYLVDTADAAWDRSVLHAYIEYYTGIAMS